VLAAAQVSSQQLSRSPLAADLFLSCSGVMAVSISDVLVMGHEDIEQWGDQELDGAGSNASERYSLYRDHWIDSEHSICLHEPKILSRSCGSRARGHILGLEWDGVDPWRSGGQTCMSGITLRSVEAIRGEGANDSTPIMAFPPNRADPSRRRGQVVGSRRLRDVVGQ